MTGCIVETDFGSGPYLCREEPRVCDDGFDCRGGICVPSSTPHDASTADVSLPVFPSFNPPQPITELNAPMSTNDDAALSADLLYVIFNSDRGGTNDFWSSRRDSIGEPWPEPIREDILSSTSFDTTLGLSPNGLHVLFSSSRPGGVGGADLYAASRVAPTSPWSMPVALATTNSADQDLASWISDDGNTIIFDSNRDGDFDIYIAERSGADFGAPTQINELNSAGDDAGARLAADGLVVVFASTRPEGLGEADIYAAVRASIADPFGEPFLVDGVNSAVNEQDAWLSDDLCTLILVDPRSGLPGILQADCIR